MIAKQSPLQGMNMGNAARMTMRELPGLSMLDLRVAPGTTSHTAVADALGLDLPSKPGQVLLTAAAIGVGSCCFCLAPDWWLIIGSQEAQKKLAELKHEYHFSAVDVSDQRTTIELEGPDAREVLAHLWEQDLREKSFPVAVVSQGLMAKAPVIVCHLSADCYRVLVRSSFALHLWKALADAAEEYA